MLLGDARAEIARIEAEIERLSEAADRCRKLSLLGRAAGWLGGLLLPPTLLGMVAIGPTGLILEITGLVGGIVLAGVNRRTRDDLLAEVAVEEARRAGLIDALPLHPATPPAGH